MWGESATGPQVQPFPHPWHHLILQGASCACMWTSLSIHPNSVHSLLQTATPWPLLGLGICEWVVWSTLRWATQGRSPCGGLRSGLWVLWAGNSGVWTRRGLGIYTEEACLPHFMAHSWKSTRVEPSKAQRPGQGSPIQWCFCFICKLHRGRASLSLICWGIPNA